MNDRPLILYHAHCTDGFCAAWVAWRHFKGEADFIAVNYGEAPPDVAGRVVYILDFSYKRPVMFRLAAKAVRLITLDHHRTAADELAGFDDDHAIEGAFTCFDMSKSGGRLAWEYFFLGDPSPWLVDYTEDYDLWKWQLPNSKEISAALASYPRSFELWEHFAKRDVGLLLDGLVVQGIAILRYQSQLIDTAVANAVETSIDGHMVLAVNATCLISQIGERLAKDRPFGATYFIRGDGKRVWSLRSREGGIDVSEVAKRHGGGGHKAAAGFGE